MRRLLVLLPLVVLACQNGTAPVVRRSAAPLAASTAPSVAAAGSAAPTPAATPARPTTPAVELKARVTLDATYLVAKGLGAIVANNGGNVVLTGNALLSDHGVGVISNNAGSRRLLAAQALLPAVGVQVQVTSLRTGQPLPLGVDAEGKPVFTTVTDAAGDVRVFIPQTEQGNVLIQAVVPGGTDPRARYDLVTSTAAAAPAVVDEDTAQATAFLRVAFAGRIASLLVKDPTTVLCELGSSDAYSPAVQAVLQQTVRELHEAGQAAGVKEGPAAEALARQMGDTVLANVDLAGIQVTPATYSGWQKQEPALPAIIEVLGHVRNQAAKRLAANPAAFDQAPYFVEGNSCKPGTYAMARPSDLNAFVVQEYLATGTAGALRRMRLVIDDVDARHPDGLAEDQATRLSAAATAVESALALAFVTDQNGAKTTALAQIRSYDPQATATPRPQPCWHETADDLKACGSPPP